MPDFAEPAAGAAADAPGAPDPAAAALAARLGAYRPGQVVVDFANRGAPIPEIAARLGISEGEARAKLREALARTLPGSPEEFAALQMSRLNEALLAAFSAMGEMGLKAVDRVVRIVRALDRLHPAARPLAAAVAAEAAEPAHWKGPRPAAPGADELPPGEGDGSRPDRSGRSERNQNAMQPSEKAQNRSQTLDPSPAPEAFVPGRDAPALHRKLGGRGGSPGVLAGAVADVAGYAAALGVRGAKRADAREFGAAPNLSAIRGGASVRVLAAAGA